MPFPLDLRLALALSVLALSPACGKDKSGSTDTSPDPEGCVTLADGNCVVETFHNPPVLEPDEHGVYTLTLEPTEIEIDGQRHCVRAYNGLFPGPTLETDARSGSEEREIRLDLLNGLLKHDYRSLSGQVCTCTDGSGVACEPAAHMGCDMDMGMGDDCTCRDEDGAECEHMYDFNLTNLHMHGSHVRPNFSPGGDCEADGPLACRDCETDTCDGDASDDTCYFSDDVLSEVQPGEGAQYRFNLDEDGTHHEGMNWYHPHIHGTTAIQTASGAVGAWIIRGPLDEIDGLANAKERVMVFQTPSVADNGFEPLADGEACTEDTLTFNDFTVLGAPNAPQVNALNGLRRPRMLTPPDQVERWRMVSSSFLDEVWLALLPGNDSDCSSWSMAPGGAMPLTQIARDGVVMPQSWEDTTWFMSSGYRIEAVFGGEGVLKDGDTWCLVAGRALQSPGETGPDGSPVDPPTAPTPADVQALLALGDLVAILNVTSEAGEATETQLPDLDEVAARAPSTTLDGVSIEDRCAAAAARTDAEEMDEVAILQVGFFTTDDPDPCDCDAYNVNCKNFGETDRSVYPYDRDLPLGEVEAWRVSASYDGHPFHIHINPYLVCPHDNVFDPMPFAHWRDTYLINLDRRVDLITQYHAFTGAFVFHCHKLTHEDDGMMQVIRVCDPDEDPTCGDYNWRSCAEGDLECIQALAATDCAIESTNAVETGLCMADLGGPFGVCGPNACGGDADCGSSERCEDYVCAPK